MTQRDMEDERLAIVQRVEAAERRVVAALTTTLARGVLTAETVIREGWTIESMHADQWGGHIRFRLGREGRHINISVSGDFDRDVDESPAMDPTAFLSQLQELVRNENVAEFTVPYPADMTEGPSGEPGRDATRFVPEPDPFKNGGWNPDDQSQAG